MRLKKIYYCPGIISLVGLLFLLPYSYNKAKPAKSGYLTLIVPQIADDKLYRNFILTDKYFLQLIKHKKKLHFELNSDRGTNQKKINLIRYEAQKLKYTFDTTTVIFVNLSDQLDYCDFVKLLDNCYADSIRRFATWDSYFIIFGEYVIPRKNNRVINGFFYDDVPTIKYGPSKSSFQKLCDLVKPFEPLQITFLVSLWLLMIITSFCYKRKQRKSLITPIS